MIGFASIVIYQQNDPVTPYLIILAQAAATKIQNRFRGVQARKLAQLRAKAKQDGTEPPDELNVFLLSPDSHFMRIWKVSSISKLFLQTSGAFNKLLRT